MNKHKKKPDDPDDEEHPAKQNGKAEKPPSPEGGAATARKTTTRSKPVPDPDKLRRGMVRNLVDQAKVTDEWRPAFDAVPRHVFLPELVWARDDESGGRYRLVPLRRSADPDRWWALAYGDTAVLTQVDDGTPAGPEQHGRFPTSSASMPSVVAAMLEALDVRPGHTVLEIGTGTGYNAALLAHRLGQQAVTTVEIDEALVQRARAALVDAGYGEVTVVAGDGENGYPPRAPYDRVISTASARYMPYSWVEQTRPGGRIVTSWTDYYNGNLIGVTVGADGTATGGIVGETAFMDLRGQRSPRVPVVRDQEHAEQRSTELHPYDVAGNRDAATAIACRVPRCYQFYSPADDGAEGTLWFVDHWSRSWASLTHVPGEPGPYQVRQYGQRMLFDEVESAYQWWTDLGAPGVHRWRFTVTPDGQRVWLPGAAGECVWSSAV